MAWTTIPSSDIDQDSPITQTLMTALRDNPISIANGDTGAPRVEAIAAMSHGGDAGAVGTWGMFSDYRTSGTETSAGSTTTGSSLRYSGADTTIIGVGSAPSGTWRCMGQCRRGGTGTVALDSPERVTVWLRIS